MLPKKDKYWFRDGFSLVEIMVAIVILAVVVIAISGYRYYSALDARKADVQITAARLGSYLLNSWKAVGGYSGYSIYELEDPGDYDPGDPNDYNPSDTDPVEFGPGLELYFNAPGSAVPDGFSALDADSNPNYRIVVNRVNYYTTLSYKDEVGEPRVLNVCVAWTNDYQTWSDSEPYQSVNLTTYAND